ncbi:hypothetical protein IFM89_009141 [Coptis chinensis]|uniref:beta-glucosidase n=1 Tax=Coptis chinensis TaxID=261450 RepID=A0A835LRE1_9MAGN|nr:hypothetical protein IFM89_009141 [Coptis chinensis]
MLYTLWSTRNELMERWAFSLFISIPLAVLKSKNTARLHIMGTSLGYGFVVVGELDSKCEDILNAMTFIFPGLGLLSPQWTSLNKNGLLPLILQRRRRRRFDTGSLDESVDKLTEKTKACQTAKMNLSDEVDLEDYVSRLIRLVFEAIEATVDKSTQVVYNENPSDDLLKSNDFSYDVVVVGEVPYAEPKVFGRPVVIKPYIQSIDALVAAWLPGSEGQGVADVLFGDFGFHGRLARTWFKSVDRLPMNIGDAHYDPLYPFGFGLLTEPTHQ